MKIFERIYMWKFSIKFKWFFYVCQLLRRSKKLTIKIIFINLVVRIKLQYIN